MFKLPFVRRSKFDLKVKIVTALSRECSEKDTVIERKEERISVDAKYIKILEQHNKSLREEISYMGLFRNKRGQFQKRA